MSRRAGDTLACMAVCPPGVEPLLDAELAAMGIARRNVVRGGVEVNLRPRQLYAANLWLRTATRVLVRVAMFDVHDFATLERNAATVNWRQWVPAGAQVTFRVSSHRSRLDHTRAIAERLAAAAGAPLATGSADWADGGSSYDDEGAPPAGPPAARFVARIDRNRLTLSADSSGEPLYQRGWRRQVAKAPLRPTLAAAMLAAVGWPAQGQPAQGQPAQGQPAQGQPAQGQPAQGGSSSGRLMLVDPFCGSGTVAIEAALAASGRPPGTGATPGSTRSFAFETWADFAPGTWASVRGEATQRLADAAGNDLTVMASDRDAGAIAATTANAARAAVGHLVAATHSAVSAIEPPPGPPPGPNDTAWVVTNPPWGGRIASGGDLRDLYATFGNVMRARFTGWRVAMLVADRHLAAHSGLGLHEALRTTAGGQPVQLLVTGPLTASS